MSQGAAHWCGKCRDLPATRNVEIGMRDGAVHYVWVCDACYADLLALAAANKDPGASDGS